MSDNLTVIQNWFHRVWNKQDVTAIDEMFAAKGMAEGLGGQILIGPQDFKVFHQALCAMVSRIEVDIDKSLEDGMWISALCTMRAVSRASGKKIQMTGTVFCMIDKGKLVQAFNHWDFMGFFEQIGLLPADALAMGLAGK